MADELVPMRQAMGEAYIGDTIMAKLLFASPATFDQRVISLLSGLGQAAETPTAQAISGDDLKAVMTALDAQDNSKRVKILELLAGSSSSNVDLASASTDSAPIAGYATQPLSVVAPSSRIAISRALKTFTLDAYLQFSRAALPSGSPIFNSQTVSIAFPASSLPPASSSAICRAAFSITNVGAYVARDALVFFGDASITITFPGLFWADVFPATGLGLLHVSLSSVLQ